MFILEIKSSRSEEFIDITGALQKIAAENGWNGGAIHLYCQHTTCGLTINEGADPAVKADLTKFFQSVAPRDGGWAHAEGNSDAHIRSSVLGVSLLIPLVDGSLGLGTWQRVYLYEGDGPRRRSLLVQLLS
ncbi:MAG: secondary thiamine-phosphate synthase enzyme YjbQ [Desulfovibrio sp.]|nr:secondary thiamine-phosphate synthase enzyme YjbQ [Desulfovibrio sp.]